MALKKNGMLEPLEVTKEVNKKTGKVEVKITKKSKKNSR